MCCLLLNDWYRKKKKKNFQRKRTLKTTTELKSFGNAPYEKLRLKIM